MWLGAWVWRPVTSALRAAGHDVYPLTLTGVADRSHLARPDVDLDTHTTDIVRLIEAEDLHDVVLVGHSYGGVPVTAAADRIPERIARVAYVDSGPLPDGTSQFDTVPPEEQERIRAEVGDGHLVPPPNWDPADDPVTMAGLDDAALAALRARSTPHPLASATQPLKRTAAGLPVPAALVACIFPLDQVQEMIEQGHPFFAGVAGADFVALPTGHWPMFSEPVRLAEILDDQARAVSGPSR
jgi:pimeloyl-ACP methyl ester carboxylesterase